MANVIGIKRPLLVAMIVVCGLLGDRAAYAISVAASSGDGQNNFGPGRTGPDDCFIRTGIQVGFNTNCNMNGALTVPLPANAGNHTISVSGAGGLFGTSCFAIVYAEDGTQGAQASFIWKAGAASALSGSVNVPTNGSMNLVCIMYRESIVNTINYNQ